MAAQGESKHVVAAMLSARRGLKELTGDQTLLDITKEIPDNLKATYDALFKSGLAEFKVENSSGSLRAANVTASTSLSEGNLKLVRQKEEELLSEAKRALLLTDVRPAQVNKMRKKLALPGVIDVAFDLITTGFEHGGCLAGLGPDNSAKAREILNVIAVARESAFGQNGGPSFVKAAGKLVELSSTDPPPEGLPHDMTYDQAAESVERMAATLAVKSTQASVALAYAQGGFIHSLFGGRVTDATMGMAMKCAKERVSAQLKGGTSAAASAAKAASHEIDVAKLKREYEALQKKAEKQRLHSERMLSDMREAKKRRVEKARRFDDSWRRAGEPRDHDRRDDRRDDHRRDDRRRW